RTQIKQNTTRVALIASQNLPGIQFNKLIGALVPPKNNKLVILPINNKLAYSAMKNNAKPMEAYSTLYPATNSASASGKSKGARLVSAKHDIKNIIKRGNKGIQNQIC